MRAAVGVSAVLLSAPGSERASLPLLLRSKGARVVRRRGRSAAPAGSAAAGVKPGCEAALGAALRGREARAVLFSFKGGGCCSMSVFGIGGGAICMKAVLIMTAGSTGPSARLLRRAAAVVAAPAERGMRPSDDARAKKLPRAGDCFEGCVSASNCSTLRDESLAGLRTCTQR